MGPNRSLRIGDNSSADAGPERVGDVPVCSTAVGPQNAPEAPPLPLGKGKKKINLIKYPRGSDFLKSADECLKHSYSTRVSLSFPR